MASSRRKPAQGVRPFLALTLGLPALLMLARLPGSPVAAALARHLSLTDMGVDLERVLGDIVFVPLGALVVVVFRLTLGIRVLGPFRSILLAFALLGTGILTGLLFLALTVAVLVLARPLIRALRMPYYGRISVMLSLVALMIVCGGLVGRWLGDADLADVAHFPVVVLCLVSEAVARELQREGVRSALWRVAATALVGVVVAGIGSLSPLRSALLERPELMLVQIALIVVVSRHAAWRLLARDPRPKRSAVPTPTPHEIPI